MYNELEMYKLFKKALQDITNISNTEIGGRNLIPNSATLQNKFTANSTYLGTRKIVDDSEALCKKRIEITCTQEGLGFHCPIFNKSADKIGKTYTWSFWAKCSTTKTGNVGHGCGGEKNITLTTTWQKFSHTWKYTDGQYSSFNFYMKWKVGETLYIRDFKIEEGHKATSWVPAPEDIESALNTKANSNDVYKKTETYSQAEINAKLNAKANSADVYKKSEVDTKLGTKANSVDVYKKTEVDTKVSTLQGNINNKANSADVYKKTETYSQTEIDTKLSSKANSADVYKKTEVDAKVNAKANSADVYKKTEIDTKLGTKANSADVYTKTQTDTKLNAKANSTDVYKKTETYSQKEIDDKLSTAGTVDTYSKTELEKLISDTALATKKSLYPVGSLYFNATSNANPSTLLGFGTWEQIAQGKTLVGVDVNDTDFNVAGKTGGSKTHTNTVEELVPHKHKSMVLGINNGGYKLDGSKAGEGQVGTEINYIYDTTVLTTVSLDEIKSAQAKAFSIMQPYITVYIWKRTA